MANVKKLLEAIVNGRQNFCCLCFRELPQVQMYSTNDMILFTDRTSLLLADMLVEVLGDKYLGNMSVTNVICKGCVSSIISFYKFARLCQQKNEELTNVVQSFNSHLDQMVKVEEYQTVYICLDNKDMSIKEYYGYNKIDEYDVKAAVELLPKLIKTKQMLLYENYEINLQEDNDNSFHDKKNDSIALSSIMYDKNGTVYKCKECLKIFPHGQNLRQHYVRMHTQKKFECFQCARIYASASLLKEHQYLSHSRIACSQCGKICNNRYSLRYHEASHNRRFKCNTCGKVYKSDKSYNRHVQHNLCHKLRKSNAESTFICMYCDKKYSQKSMLTAHVKLEHLNIIGFECNWCERKYGSQSKLKEHLITHTKEKNFVCDICSGRFVTKNSLLNHRRTHSGERPYKCEWCDKAFICASRRTEHMRRHHLPHSYQCDICDKMFKQRRCLKKHLLKHANATSPR